MKGEWTDRVRRGGGADREEAFNIVRWGKRKEDGGRRRTGDGGVVQEARC